MKLPDLLQTGEKKKDADEQLLFGLDRKKQLLLFSGILAAVLVLVAIFVVPQSLYGLFIGVGVMIAFIPYSLTTYVEGARTKNMEEHLPAFMRDIAEARKTGMTLPEAVYKSIKVDYGALSPFVQKMAYQISWGIPFNEVLSRFAKKSKSRFIERSISIVLQAQVSGGSLTETLDSVARDASLIIEAEKDRASKLNQQSMMMYAIFILFVIIIVALQKLMVPLVSAKGFAVSSADPEAMLSFYRNLFFTMIIVQAVFSGMIAGQISENSPVIGLKHSAILLVIGVVISWFTLFS